MPQAAAVKKSCYYLYEIKSIYYFGWGKFFADFSKINMMILKEHKYTIKDPTAMPWTDYLS